MNRSLFGFVLPMLMVGLVLVCFGFLAQSPALATPANVSRDTLDDPVTILYWHQYSGDREEFIEQMIDEFNTTNPFSITVVGEYAGNYSDIYDRVLEGLRGGETLPNAVVGYPNSFADYARYGAVQFLDDYLDDPVLGITDQDDFYPGMLDYFRLDQYGDQLAGLQNGRSLEVMYYNDELLSGAGMAIPTTWHEFEAACMSIAAGPISGTIPGTDASRFSTWLWSRGGELLSDDVRQARFHEQPGIQSLLLFQRLFDGAYARPSLVAYEELGLFGEGKVGFTFGSSAVLPYYHQAMDSGAGHSWGVTHVPSDPGQEVVDSYGGGIGVLHESEVKDQAAWLFIRWLTEMEQTARWAAMSGYFPVRISAAEHPSMTQKLEGDLQYAQAFDLQSLGRTEPAIRNYELVRRIIGDAVSEAFYHGANVTDTLQAAALEVDLLLAESGPASASIPPSGGTLVYTSTEGLSATVDFAPGAVAVTQTVSYVPLDDLPTSGLAFALAPNMSFSRPVTITIRYRDSDVEGMDENELQFYTYAWSSHQWVPADPCGGYVRDPSNNILQAMVCHFSDYAMMEQLHFVYLPVVLRNWGP